GSTTWVRVAAPAANATSFTDSALAPATRYYYQVKAANAAGNSPYSNLADATTPADIRPPAAPSGLAAAAKASTRIDLAWTDNSGDETQFKIDRRQSGTTAWVRIQTSGSDTTSFSDTGLTPGVKFYYKVKAYNAAGNSPYSNVAAATTPAGTTPPAAPANLTASAVSDTGIDLGWTDRSDNEDGFKIDRRQSGFSEWVRATQTPANRMAYSDSGLLTGKRYYYKVKAYNAAGNSAYTALADATTTAPGGAAPTMAADEDDLPDAWETRFGLDANADDMDADPDGDGFRNYEEYVAGTDPSDGAACLRLQLARGAGGALVVAFLTVKTEGSEYDGLTRYYLLERCVEFDGENAWSSPDGYSRIPGTGETVTYTDDNPDGIDTCYRARVWLE
ncbi:MAG: fibronectin type III domain-containing protein, partial [Kiritimatiellae bacterium]|nr:fibronectin type III domain-containing protein [Kiritimatiellia bacterium]